jgi:uncharacterized protein
MAVNKELLDVLVCPACKGELRATAALDALDCAACKLRYPIVNDIPVMLIEEAVPLPLG